jgi:hypothetical protein
MNIQDNRETANKAVREWKSHHQQTYSDFKRQVAAIGSGDLSLMERTMGLPSRNDQGGLIYWRDRGNKVSSM